MPKKCRPIQEHGKDTPKLSSQGLLWMYHKRPARLRSHFARPVRGTAFIFYRMSFRFPGYACKRRGFAQPSQRSKR